MRGATWCAIAGVFLISLVSNADAAATFTLINLDGPAEGFNDPTPWTPTGGNFATTLGQARINAFQFAADIWGECLNSSVPIQIEVEMNPLFCSSTGAVLGQAGANTVHKNFGTLIFNNWYPQALANSQAGFDLAPADADIGAVFNSDINGSASCLSGADWYYGFDGNVPIGDLDFISVVLHELGHGLGVQTYVNLTTGAKFMLLDDGYEQHLEQHFVSFYATMTDAQRVTANTSDPDLHWLGEAIQTASSGLSGGVSNGHVRMHAPSTLSLGSSVNHFSTALTPSELMEPNYVGANHDPGLAINLLDDIGWSVGNKTLKACEGAIVDVTTGIMPPPGAAIHPGGSNQERGVFVKALKDFEICALGMEVHHFQGQTVTASVYDANNLSRGPLLASGTLDVAYDEEQIVYIPINFTFQECREYDIAVRVGDAFEWRFWPEFFPPMPPAVPADAAGVFSVQKSELNGDPALSNEVPYFSAIGQTPTPYSQSILQEPAILWTSCTDAVTARGAYVTAAQTLRTCWVSFEANFQSFDFLRKLRVNIYDGNGLVRGPLIATGTTTITNVGVVSNIEIPVNALLEEGHTYDIEVEYPQTTYSCWDESSGVPGPFTVDDAFTVVDGEKDGNPADIWLPKLSVGYDFGPGSEPFDLVAPFRGSPNAISSAGGVDYGIYMLANLEIGVHSVGWYADVPVGALIRATIYESTGLTRGTLMTSNTIASGESGPRWHDVPLAAAFVGGAEYDVVFDITAANSYPTWNDAIPGAVPYTAYGGIQILEGESGGNPGDPTLIQMRVNNCPLTAVGVEPSPASPPKFTLADPYPNPMSAAATVAFSLDEATTASVAVYDVAGRRVAELMPATHLPAGPGQVTFDRRNLASGVYFVRLSTPDRSLSRRVVLVR